MRGPTLYGSDLPLPEKRSRSISNVSLRILALLFCCEQLILNMRRTSRASLWGSNPTESTTISREEEPVYKQRVTSDIGSPFLLRATDIEHAANVARIALGFQSDGEHDHVQRRGAGL